VTQGTTVMATKKNSFMTQITSAMDKAALGAAAATRLVCDPAKVGGLHNGSYKGKCPTHDSLVVS